MDCRLCEREGRRIVSENVPLCSACVKSPDRRPTAIEALLRGQNQRRKANKVQPSPEPPINQDAAL